MRSLLKASRRSGSASTLRARSRPTPWRGAALDRFGSIDVLINNASLMSVLPRRSWLEIPVEEWDRVMAVNLRGMFLACRAVFPAMQAQKRGKIVNISSSRFFEGTPNRLHYTTSKAGVIGFTRALAREVGEFGITVNAVAPGVTLSETQVASSSGNYLGTRLAGRTIDRAASSRGSGRRGDVPVVGCERLHDRPDAAGRRRQGDALSYDVIASNSPPFVPAKAGTRKIFRATIANRSSLGSQMAAER